MKYKLKMLPKKIFYDTLIIEVYILPDLGGQAFFLKLTLFCHWLTQGQAFFFEVYFININYKDLLYICQVTDYNKTTDKMERKTS